MSYTGTGHWGSINQSFVSLSCRSSLKTVYDYVYLTTMLTLAWTQLVKTLRLMVQQLNNAAGLWRLLVSEPNGITGNAGALDSSSFY